MADDLTGSIQLNVQLNEGGAPTAAAADKTVRNPNQGQGTDQAPSKTEDSSRQRQFTLRNLLQLSVMGVGIISLVRNSTVMSTFFGSYFKVLGALFDMLLAPFTPILQLILSGIVKTAFWLEQHIGPYLRRFVDWFMSTVWPTWRSIAETLKSIPKMPKEGVEKSLDLWREADKNTKVFTSLATGLLGLRMGGPVGGAVGLALPSMLEGAGQGYLEYRKATEGKEDTTWNRFLGGMRAFYRFATYPLSAEANNPSSISNSTQNIGTTINMPIQTVRQPHELGQAVRDATGYLNMTTLTRGR